MIGATPRKPQGLGRLEHELASLFSSRVVAKSRHMTRAEMQAEAELVAEGARQLLEHKGQVKAQRRIVQCMDEITAIALCKWIREATA